MERQRVCGRRRDDHRSLNHQPTHSFAAPSCTVCDTATDFVRDTAFLADCRACCVVDAEADTPRAASAVLEVCSSRLRAFPHTESFIKSHASKYNGRVTVRQRWGWPPRLLLLGDGGQPLGAPVAVDQWKTETIIEFLAGRGLEAKGGGKQ